MKSSSDMLQWQYRNILEQLGQVELHASDPTCPCLLADEGEYCLPKHLLMVRSLAAETAPMDEPRAGRLNLLADEALERHIGLKDFFCHDEAETPVLVSWARGWRKEMEQLYYACAVRDKEVEAPPPPGPELDTCTALTQALTIHADYLHRPPDPKTGSHQWHQHWIRVYDKALGEMACPNLPPTPPQPKVHISGSCGADRGCTIKVKAKEEVEEMANIGDLAAAVGAVTRQLEERHKEKPTTKTFALGQNQLTRYELEYVLIEAGDLIASHSPFTFNVNPAYPPDLQPRLRARAAPRVQVEHMAANLDPNALLTEFHAIDRGAPIIGPDNVVESGNGRVMAIQLAIAEQTSSYRRYREALETQAPQFGFDPKAVKKLSSPVLVRRRLTEMDRRAFVEEANASPVLTTSAIEQARSDAVKITPAMIDYLQIGDDEAIEDALRAPRNIQFISAFLDKISAQERGALTDAKGMLNQDGIRRIVMALFLSAFPAEIGLRLAEKFFESTEPSVRNVFNGLVKALGLLSRAESLVRAEERNPELAIGADIAQAVVVFAEIKKAPWLTVSKYLAQIPMFERQLTDFQEELLKALDERSRSSKRIAALFKTYAEMVIDSPPPAQIGLLPGAQLSKEEIFGAVKKVIETDLLKRAAPRLPLTEARPPEEMTPDIKQALADWRSKRAYLDNAGNYRIRPKGKSSGPIAPWNKAAKRAFPSVAELHQAAEQSTRASPADNPKGLPPCTAAQTEKLERCIVKVKAKGEVKSPWAICQASVGCKARPG